MEKTITEKLQENYETKNPFLDLSFYHQRHIEKDDLKILEKCTHLTYLNIRHLMMPSDCSFFQKFTHLTSLDLSDCDISDKLFFQNFPKLEYLEVCTCQLPEISSLEDELGSFSLLYIFLEFKKKCFGTI